MVIEFDRDTPSSVRVTRTLKKDRPEKDPLPSPADSDVAQPLSFRLASMLPWPSCLQAKSGDCGSTLASLRVRY